MSSGGLVAQICSYPAYHWVEVPGFNGPTTWVADRENKRTIGQEPLSWYNCTDTADTYGTRASDKPIGCVVIAEIGARDDVVIATTFGHAVESDKPD
jgi:aryl-alcohol dehydrogenase-like predicted oxidoreductase